MGTLEVDIRVPGQSPRSVRREGSVHLGRAPDNDVVLDEERVSWRHALVYEEGGETWIRDLGSRNGTLVDGEAIKAPTRLSERSRVRIGSVDIGVRRAASSGLRSLLLQEADSGVRHPLLRERFVISDNPEADLRHPQVSEPITVLLPGHGEVWLGVAGEDREVTLGEEIVIEDFRFSILEADPERVPTVEASGSPYDYTLTATLDGGPGPLAEITDARTQATCRFTAETRATLLFTLARQITQDREANVPKAEQGWVADPELVIAVWGRTPLPDGLARLKTLVHRIRSDCRSAGLDPWCVEKRRGHTRIRANVA